MTKKDKKEESSIDIFKNRLVPSCRILKDDEKEEFLKRYNISKYQLPVIFLKDPMASLVNAEKGDILEITRTVCTAAGKSKYYRLVVGGSN